MAERRKAFMEMIASNPLILTEAALIENLKHNPSVELHPKLENALLIYDEVGNVILKELYRDFIETAICAELPILVCSPTWRSNPERIGEAGIVKNVNRDAVNFLLQLRAECYAFYADKVWIGGLMGCQRDCYKPDDAPDADTAEAFHRYQAETLANAHADFLLAATLPSVNEAEGMARAMKRTGRPYFISFLLTPNGRVPDGETLDTAFRRVDDAASDDPPVGFMINCAHPSFLDTDAQSDYVRERLIGFQANASSKNHEELDGSEMVHQDDIREWGELMLRLNREHDVKILGGCCGTRTAHLQYIAREHIMAAKAERIPETVAAASCAFATSEA